jgi:ribose transport system substrate-binding protein
MMEVLTGKKKLSGNNIEYPLPWVEPKDAKVCKGDSFVDGCNTFPADKVPPLFIDTALNGELLPELSLKSVQDGTPRHHPALAGGAYRRQSRWHQLRQLRDGKGLA